MTTSLEFSEYLKAVRAEVQKRGLNPSQRKSQTPQQNNPVWQPQTGPQSLAYNSEADIIGYGGAAGGGKTDLLLGFAGTKHRRAIIFRRVFPSLRGMIERSREIFNRVGAAHVDDSYNEQLHVWRLTDGRMIEFGAVQHDKDRKKHQGQARDFFGFDEATEFPESVVRFLIGWNRTTVKGQKCRVVMTFNPPMDEAGDWVTRFYAPWLDPEHHNPAEDGELRWYAMIDGEEAEVDSGEPFDHNGEIIIPKSRTFFHASLKDNPILEATGYGATIDAMPDPLRSILKGSFSAARVEDAYQVIPAAWIRLAIARGKGIQPSGDQTALGVDVARGGKDKTIIAPRYGLCLAPMLKYPGRETMDGATVAQLVMQAIRGNPVVNMDAIGVGSSPVDFGREVFMVNPVNFGEGTTATDSKSGKLRFGNVRAAAYWRLRELLDPESGPGVALPDDRELLADLAAPRWELRAGGRVFIESKDDIKDRLGRSPDCGDAAVLAFWGDDPLPPGVLNHTNPSAQSAFARANVSGGRFGRGDDRRGWHKR